MQTRPRTEEYIRKHRRKYKEGAPGLELRPYQVVLRPWVTEKGTAQSSEHNAYAFQVNPIATKAQIKQAVEELFEVRVERVRTQNYHGKKRRFKYKVGQMPRWKKAIVTLNEEDRIEFF